MCGRAWLESSTLKSTILASKAGCNKMARLDDFATS
jgi:hypothetical protein